MKEPLDPDVQRAGEPFHGEDTGKVGVGKKRKLNPGEEVQGHILLAGEVSETEETGKTGQGETEARMEGEV